MPTVQIELADKDELVLLYGTIMKARALEIAEMNLHSVRAGVYDSRNPTYNASIASDRAYDRITVLKKVLDALEVLDNDWG